MPHPTDPHLEPAIPIIRIFDVDKAMAFYVGQLGFTLDWEHRFGPDFPLYAQVSRSRLVLHLSEHSGDATPGATVHVRVQGLDDLYREFAGRGCKATIEPGPSNHRLLQVWDPFSNRLRFAERNDVEP